MGKYKLKLLDFGLPQELFIQIRSNIFPEIVITELASRENQAAKQLQRLERYASA